MDITTQIIKEVIAERLKSEEAYIQGVVSKYLKSKEGTKMIHHAVDEAIVCHLDNDRRFEVAIMEQVLDLIKKKLEG